MSRILTVGAAQLGPIARDEPRGAVVERLLTLMRKAHARGCALVVYPELALTTFFPRWYMPDQAEVDAFFEAEMPNEATAPLFAEARRLGIGFHLGYAELVEEDGRQRHFNTAILVDQAGQIVSKYRKVHLPGHSEHEPERPFQHLEKRYFEPGDLGFPVVRAFDGVVGMCICNDRRWPETYRVMGLQGVELIVLGYNTPTHFPPAPEHDHLQNFHNHLVMQSGAYQNGTWVVGRRQGGPRGRLRPDRAERDHRPDRRARRHVLDARRRARRDGLRSRPVPVAEEEHVQLRAPPPATALRPDHRAHGRRSAARLTGSDRSSSPMGEHQPAHEPRPRLDA